MRVPGSSNPVRKRDIYVRQYGNNTKAPVLKKAKYYMKGKHTKETKSKSNDCSEWTKASLKEVSGVFLPVQGRPIYVYSAYYDDRKAAGGPVIRVIASGLQAEYNTIQDVFCLLWYTELPTAGRVKAEYHRIYQSTLYHDEYTAHFINCKVNESKVIPKSISIIGDLCNETRYVLPIKKIEARSLKTTRTNLTFGLCVSPIYNKFNDVGRMIEFIEIHRILGVSKFTIYDFSIGIKVKKLLDTYVKEGVLQVIPWHVNTNLRQFYFSQRESLNDCLYRNMDVVDFLAVHDLDEVIVPRVTSQWLGMVKNLTVGYIGAYLFQHAYFKRNKTFSGSTDPYLITQTSLSRTNKVVPAGKIRCKSMYDPRKVLKIDIHFPYQLLPGFKELIVDPKIAILHHYRAQSMQILHKPNSGIKFITDTYMQRYGLDLIESYKSRLKYLQ